MDSLRTVVLFLLISTPVHGSVPEAGAFVYGTIRHHSPVPRVGSAQSSKDAHRIWELHAFRLQAKLVIKREHGQIVMGGSGPSPETLTVSTDANQEQVPALPDRSVSTGEQRPAEALTNQSRALSVLSRAVNTFVASVSLLRRKLDRVREKRGPENRRWASVGNYLRAQTATGFRIVGSLAQDPSRLRQLAAPDAPSLVPYAPAILARLDRLESHVAPILEKVLNNRTHMAFIEPNLEGILERFDDIEPHLPWVLARVEELAPHTALLLAHIDELLLYADLDATERRLGSRYALADQLLPHLSLYAARLDAVGPHLPLLRPHVGRLLHRNRIGKISPHLDKLLAGGLSLEASANADVLLFYLGWLLDVPLLPRLLFALPLPFARIVSWLATRLPKRFVRRCVGVECTVDWDYGENWNSLSRR